MIVRSPLRATPRSSALIGFVVIASSVLPLGTAMAASPTNQSTESSERAAPCSMAAVQASERKALDRFLQSRGLALTTQCQASAHTVQARLVVLDSNKASNVLRGPLADGETVETGATESAGQSSANATMVADSSPDVHFNRSWLQSAMAKHHFAAAMDGTWRIKTNANAVHLALR